ncbi:MAG: LPD7 domain-containing protein, partial [Caldimonas sp.]
MATSDYRDPRGEFAVALKSAGLIVEDGPVMDGQLHRVRVEGAKPGTRDGSYVGFADGKPSGYIKNFKTGYEENWNASDVQFTAAELAESIAQMQRARAQRAAELSAQQSDTAKRVGVRWESLADVPPAGQNVYLTRKGVQAHGVKFDGERLVVPLRDVRGKLWSLQAIPPDEGAPKMFERGGRKAGNMHVIGEIKAGAAVLVAEGYATGASLHQATGKTVAVAFDAGNLDAVVGAIKQRYPTSPVVIMGDNDRTQEPNVGYEKATAAAQKHGVAVAFPQFREPGELSDFNDLHTSEGLDAVRAQADKALGRSTEHTRVPPLSVPPRDAVAAEIGKGIETSVVRVPTATAEAPVRDADERLTSRDVAIGTAHVAQLANVGGPTALVAVQVIGVVDAANAVSNVAQGKEVKALDVASAAASVAMTTGVGGPVVHLGAQAIASVSAIDTGQRALNTAKAKLKEPDPADVTGRKGTESRNDEIAAVPRNALDERSAREVVEQDVGGLHLIDTPTERHAAAVAMGHNAQTQATYKTELARQDPNAAEVVALAFAQEQQKIAAKEDRKATDTAAVAPAVAAVDAANRTAQRQEGVTVERSASQQAVVNRIERVAHRETEPDTTVRQRIESPLEDRFNVVSRFGRGRDYHFRDQPGKIAFKERWLSMQTSSDAPAVIKAMIDRAQERGWEAIRVKGSEEFQRQVWIAATARGLKAVGYEPTQGDRTAVNEERVRLKRAEVKSPTETMPPGPTPRPGTWRDQAPERPAAEPSVARRSPETANPQQPHAQTAEKPIAGPLRSFLTERGVAAAEVDATVTVASERMQQGRVYVGQVVSHGADHYEFDKKNEQSYYVKLQTVAGEKVIWGVDLRRALTDDKIKVGESVAIEHRGMQPVTVVVKDRNATGNVIGEHEEAAKRNTWHAVRVDQLRRDAMKASAVEPSKQGPSAEPAADTPSQARTSRTNRHEPQVLQAFEKALDTKKVPEELRPAARAEVRKQLDVRMSYGQAVKVAIYDPAAPSREAQRTVQ